MSEPQRMFVPPENETTEQKITRLRELARRFAGHPQPSPAFKQAAKSLEFHASYLEEIHTKCMGMMMDRK